jgi:hypothetical protein
LKFTQKVTSMMVQRVAIIVFAVCNTLSFSGLSYAASDKAVVVSSVEQLPDITEIFSEQLGKIQPGLTLDQFRIILPEAKPRGFVNSLQIFELNTKTIYRTNSTSRCLWFGEAGDDCSDHVYKQSLWFAFQAGQLKTWGKPVDFQKAADVVIENRQ